jgi:hypothetical protein
LNFRDFSVVGISIAATIMLSCKSSGQPSHCERIDLPSIIESISPFSDTTVSNHNRIIFLIRFIDFGCQHCLQNFFELCDSIEMMRKKSLIIPVYLLFLRDQTSPGYQLTAMTSWARSSGLPYPVALISNDVFKRYGIENSSVLLMERKDTLVNFGEIPLSKSSIHNILRKAAE